MRRIIQSCCLPVWQVTMLSILALTVIVVSTNFSDALSTDSRVISVRTDDPRCADVSCEALNRPIPEAMIRDFPLDPTACANGTYCPTCLTDDAYWRPLLDALGTGTAIRDADAQPTLIINDWLTSELVDTITNILLSETMGFVVDTVPFPIDGTTEVLCCVDNLLEMEKWETGNIVDDDGYFSLKHSALGFQGASGLFVPGHTAAAFPLATAFNAYNYLDEYKNIFPKGMSTNCTKLIVNQTLGCVDGNFICDLNAWTNTTCVQGRYIPPQCEDDPTNCSEVLMANPTWDAGYFEGLIKNTGLPFITTYLGSTGLNTELTAMQANGSHFIFYWFEPDALTASFDAQPVNFVPHNTECEQKRSTDPTLSGHDCGAPVTSLQKYARRDTLAKDVDLEFFFDKFQLGSSEIKSMLQSHTTGGGTDQVYNLSCSWVKNNYATWSSWVQNTAPSNVTSGVTAVSQDVGQLIAFSAGIPVGVIILIGIVIAVVLQHRAAKAVKNAPKKPPLAMVFTDIQSSTMLWEQYGSSMAAALDQHNEVIREVLEKYQCYEVKTIGDAFIIASHSLLDLTMMVMEMQRALQAVQWPDDLIAWKKEEAGAPLSVASNSPHKQQQPPESPGMLDFYNDEDFQRGLFKGLRVRVGIHYCTEIEAKFDRIHGRFDYFGHDMNLSARVQSIAAGGQVLMTEDTWRALAADPQFSILSEDVTVKCVSRGVELKGVAEKVRIFQVLPNDLQYRKFAPLEGAVDELVLSIGAADASSKGSSLSASRNSETMSLLSGGGNGADRERYACIKYCLDTILKGIGEPRERDGFIHKVGDSLSLPQGPTMRRLAMIRKSLHHEVSKTLEQQHHQQQQQMATSQGEMGDWAAMGALPAPANGVGRNSIGRLPSTGPQNSINSSTPSSINHQNPVVNKPAVAVTIEDDDDKKEKSTEVLALHEDGERKEGAGASSEIPLPAALLTAVANSQSYSGVTSKNIDGASSSHQHHHTELPHVVWTEDGGGKNTDL